MANILDQLEYVLSSNSAVDPLFDQFVSNQHVLSAGLRPTRGHFVRYLEGLNSGFQYVSRVYGEVCLPEQLTLYGGLLTLTGEADFIFYSPERDEVGLSLLHIAQCCAYFDHPFAFMPDSHLPAGYGVRTIDYPVLQAIEEGYHRLQTRRHAETVAVIHDADHPWELEVRSIWERAMLKLGIGLFRLVPARPA